MPSRSSRGRGGEHSARRANSLTACDVAEAAELFVAREVEVATDDRNPSRRVDPPHDMDADVAGVDADQDVPEPGPDETVRAAHEALVFVRRVYPVRPVGVGPDRPGEGLPE